MTLVIFSVAACRQKKIQCRNFFIQHLSQPLSASQQSEALSCGTLWSTWQCNPTFLMETITGHIMIQEEGLHL